MNLLFTQHLALVNCLLELYSIYKLYAIVIKNKELYFASHRVKKYLYILLSENFCYFSFVISSL